MRWKLAILRPLLKKIGLELVYNNYRPVSNLNFISKVVEKAMLEQLNYHIKINELASKYQSAYREHHSCETSVLKIVNDLLWNMEDKKLTALIAIDLSVAFDTVDHEILLKTLENSYGISDTSLNWFASYLKDRRFKVSVENIYSEEKCFNYGVPQRSCLGPNLFRAATPNVLDPSLFPCKSQGWVGGEGGNPPTYPPAYPPTPPPPHLPTYPPHPPTPPPPPTHPQLASSSTDTFKQRENQNKEKLTKVAAYEL